MVGANTGRRVGRLLLWQHFPDNQLHFLEVSLEDQERGVPEPVLLLRHVAVDRSACGVGLQPYDRPEPDPCHAGSPVALIVGQSLVMHVVLTDSPQWHKIANAILR
jgi:hypothetical protein